MLSGNSCFGQNSNPLQCCFIPFFSERHPLFSNQQRNTDGFGVTSEIIQPISFKKETPLYNHPQKASLINVKRSISDLKQKILVRNRSTLDTQLNIPVLNLDLHDKKQKSSLRNSHHSHLLHRYHSPTTLHSNGFDTCHPEERKKYQCLHYERNQLNFSNLQQQKSNHYFKKQQVKDQINFSKSSPYKPQYLKLQSCKLENNSQYNLMNPSKSQIPLKTWQKINIQSTATNFGHSSRSKNSSKNSQTQKFNTSINASSRRDNPQQPHKQTQKIRIQIRQNENKLLKKSSLQNILQQKKQEIQETEQHLTIPQNPFKHIQSFVQITKCKVSQGHQKQYESIKTKGRPVQSMLQLTKDLAKTKKMRKQNKRRNEPGLNQMQNMTVTSQYDDEQSRGRIQKIEQSAVLLNFFNPPKDVKDRLQLSKHTKHTNVRSGFY